MRDVRHAEEFLPKLPLDIAIVRESIHKRTEYEATLPLSRRRSRTSVTPATAHQHEPQSRASIATRSITNQGVVAAMDWRHRAACRDEDPELFFPIGTSGPALLQVEQAKAVCRRCSVVDACLQWALETGQDAGVWGGMSEEERRAVKRRGGLRVRAHSL
jgi:WhiB family redox-sensing transcriptional regulator